MQQVNIVLLDDVDGSPAEETIVFGLDGNMYEIDVSDKNATVLRDALAPFIGVARKTHARTGRLPAKMNGAAAKAAAAGRVTAKKATVKKAVAKKTAKKTTGGRGGKRVSSIEQIAARKSVGSAV